MLFIWIRRTDRSRSGVDCLAVLIFLPGKRRFLYLAGILHKVKKCNFESRRGQNSMPVFAGPHGQLERGFFGSAKVL